MRDINKELMIKIINMSSELLRMHAEVVGERICQDWSGRESMTPSKFFSKDELDVISYNYELQNSNLEDYEEGVDFLDDEMVLSFAMSTCLSTLTTNNK